MPLLFVVTMYRLIVFLINSCDAGYENIWYGDAASDFHTVGTTCFNSSVRSNECDETKDHPTSCLGICQFDYIATRWISTQSYLNVSMTLTLEPYMMNESTSHICEINFQRQGEGEWTTLDTVGDPNRLINKTYYLYKDKQTLIDNERVAFNIEAVSNNPDSWCYLSYLSIDGYTNSTKTLMGDLVPDNDTFQSGMCFVDLYMFRLNDITE